jgi:cobyrinic acid a,c-diamide synthase
VVDGLIIAAPASGSGKTVVTLGLLRHLARSGVAVASAKVGPDYIDPAFHAAASGRPCLNLDPWAMRPVTRQAIVARLAEGAQLVICEGVMGLFDGATHDSGSTADVVQWSGWPVVLVVDVRAQAASAAAVVRGFASHRAGVRVGGVVFNRVGSDRHADVLRLALADALPGLPILGMLPRDAALAVPERHLGLVQATEHASLDAFLDRAADTIAAHVDTERLMTLARPALDGVAAGDAAGDEGADALAPLPPLGQRISVADDAAFAFAYPAVLTGWRNQGAEIVPFSPLANEAPDAAADAVYLPGGYPELHAGRIAAAGRFGDGLRDAAARGAVVLGECGGYMVMGDGLVDADGARHAMAGLLRLDTSFSRPRLHLGYRDAALVADGPLGRAGGRFRGHEFHYARVEREGPGEALFRCYDASGQSLGTTGLRQGAVLGSFVHLIDAAG